MNGPIDLWLERAIECGGDRELLEELLTDIYEQGVSDGRREDAARPEEY
jgi:hypothetical protein